MGVEKSKGRRLAQRVHAHGIPAVSCSASRTSLNKAMVRSIVTRSLWPCGESTWMQFWWLFELSRAMWSSRLRPADIGEYTTTVSDGAG